jgi:hypothetical protein
MNVTNRTSDGISPDAVELLRRWAPVMQYDSHEPYLADHVGVITDHPGNQLRAADGTVVATATAEQGLLGLLGLEGYRGTRTTPTQADRLTEVYGDYQAQAARMHERPDLANRIHGRYVEDQGARWLQYWFFMYYDNPGILDFGVHEGDLEMIELELGPDDLPATAVYAHHNSGFRVPYSEIETEQTLDGPVPVVYSARGSHASMLRSGHIRAGSVVTDHNDAKGPRLRPEVVVLDPIATPWVDWPGSWGGTRPPDQLEGDIEIAAYSPFAFGRHTSWKQPSAFATGCPSPPPLPPPGAPMTLPEPAPPAPAITVSRSGGQLAVDYDARQSAADGASHVSVAVAPVHGNAPAVTRTVPLPSSGQGTIMLPAPDDGHIVHASTARRDGTASETTTVD